MKIGLLPFYIRLYDEVSPQNHEKSQQFADHVAGMLGESGFEVVTTELCRVAEEFSAAVKKFEDAGCRVIVTLHSAYSPSLESISALCASRLPLVVADTTPDAEFPFDFGSRLSFNHGIHGVQDMCNLLLRHGKPFLIRAGHYQDRAFQERLRQAVLAAGMVYAFTHGRVGCIGEPFAGMGDFQVPEGSFGMKVSAFRPEDAADPAESEVEAEMALDRAHFLVDPELPEAVHRATEQACLKLRNWLESQKLDAFTLNFLRCGRSTGWDVVPFLECSRAMARGVGYAGEGDLLTALLCGTLLKFWKNTTFTEMFCPDWKGNRILLSHMGEMNLNLMDQKPHLARRAWKFSDADDQALATGCMRSGKAVLVNLAPGADNTFSLICARISLTAQNEKTLRDMRGWFQPPAGMEIGTFLECYSRLGGTHHSVLSYDGDMEVLHDFAHLMNWRFREIRA